MKTSFKVTIAAMLLLLSCSNEKENTETYVKQGYDEGYEQGFKDGFEYGYAEGLKNGGNEPGGNEPGGNEPGGNEEPSYLNLVVKFNQLISDQEYSNRHSYGLSYLDENGTAISGSGKDYLNQSDLKVSDTLGKEWELTEVYGFGDFLCDFISFQPTDSLVIVQNEDNDEYLYKRRNKLFDLFYFPCSSLSKEVLLNTFGNRIVTRYSYERKELFSNQQVTDKMEGLTVIYLYIFICKTRKSHTYDVAVMGVRGTTIEYFYLRKYPVK